MKLPANAELLAKARIIFSIGLVLAMLAVAVKLAFAPLYRRYDARQCREAYAAARTHAESVAVDLHPYGARHESRNRRCGETRAVPVDTLRLGRPDEEL
jgi:hypothetical protein